MQKSEIMDTLKEQKKMLEDMGFSVAYLALYGSQNYGLSLHTAEYKSDIDTKAVIIPTLDDLVNNSKPVSKKIESSVGEIDVKDIRVYMASLLKGNPAYLETIFTDYHIIDDRFGVEMDLMLVNREHLVYALRVQLLKAIYGMMLEKQKALCHPYPSTAWKIEKWDYDGKQSSHCLRLFDMAISYFKEGKAYKDCLIPSLPIRIMIMEHKLNKLSLEDVKEECDDCIYEIRKLRDKHLEDIDENTIDYSIKDYYLELSKKIIKDKIEKEIFEQLSRQIFSAFCDFTTHSLCDKRVERGLEELW